MIISTKRYHEIDALRVIALMLLMFYHAFISYQAFADYISFIQYDQLLEEYWFVGELLNIWRIPVLFVISGMAVGFMIQRRTMNELIKDRLMRLVPPLVFGSLFIAPITLWFYTKYQGETPDYFPYPAHLWFLVNLICYIFILYPLLSYVKKNPENNLIRGMRKVFPLGLLIIMPLPLILESIISQPEFFSGWLGRFWYGLVCYGLGFLFLSVGEKFWSSIRQICHAALSIALLFYLARVNVISIRFLSPNEVTMSIESGVWMLAFLGYGSFLLNKPFKIFGYLNKAVFPVYIIHLPVQQIIAYYIFPWGLSPVATLIIHVSLTFTLCFLLYEFVFRRVKFLYPVMGLKVAKKTDTSINEEKMVKERIGSKMCTAFTYYLLTPTILLYQISTLRPYLNMLYSSEVGIAPNPNRVALPTEPMEFDGHYYQVFEKDDGILWSEAKNQCETLGAHLVIINSLEENEFLSTIGTGNGFYHLGATDSDNEGEWKWIDGTALDYANWSLDEPNNYGGDEDYLNAYYKLWPQWNDASESAIGYVCEWDEKPSEDID
ncbi:MAG: acyltransferase family protein [Bacteroidota bacterium]